MLIKEDEGWIIKVDSMCGASGHHKTALKCLEASLHHGYEYFIED